MKGPLFAFIFLTAALRTGAVLAGASSVTLTELGHDVFKIEGRFTVQASSRETWLVLSDYDHIGEFVSSVNSSKTKERHADHLLVEQTNRDRFWFFAWRFGVLLKVRETPNQKIEFEDLLKKDFKSYQGFWQIESSEGETFVRYYLLVEHRARVPSFVTREFIRKDVERLLTEVAAEIERRGKTED